MLLKPQDGKERGVIVSRRNNRLITSRILEGFTEEAESYDSNGKKRASFTPPFMPHGLRSLVPGIKDIVIVHTHFMSPKSNHLRTTLFSDADIHRFMTSDWNGIVMVDRGGAHLLVRTHKSFRQDELLRKDIITESVSRGIQKDSEVLDVIKDAANQLANYGLGYFYTPVLTPDPKGFVEFYEPGSLH